MEDQFFFVFNYNFIFDKKIKLPLNLTLCKNIHQYKYHGSACKPSYIAAMILNPNTKKYASMIHPKIMSLLIITHILL